MSREPCNNIATNLQQHCNNIATNLQSKEELKRAIEYFESLIFQLADSPHDGPILNEHKTYSREMAQTALAALRSELSQRAINEMCGHCRHEHGSHACQNAECSRRIYVDALRSELDRVGCEYCNDGEAMACGQDSLRRAGYIYLDGNLLTADLYSDSMAVAVCYCPMCGKKLREDKTDD